MTTLPGLVKDTSPPATDTQISPISIPNGTTLFTTKQHNKIIDYLSGDAGPDFIPQAAIKDLVAALATAGNTFARVVKKVDEIINSQATLQDDDELFVALSANKKYSLLLFFTYASDAVPDFRSAFSFPTGATGERLNGAWQTGLASVVVDATDEVLFAGNGVAVKQMSLYRVSIIMGGTPGNVTFQWRQNSSSVLDTTVFAGSSMVVYEELP